MDIKSYMTVEKLKNYKNCAPLMVFYFRFSYIKNKKTKLENKILFFENLLQIFEELLTL